MNNKSTKMDLHGARTPADIERKYNFGKSFAELQGVATDARTAAEEANTAAEKVGEELNNLFAHDIEMTGTFTHKNDVFLKPGNAELQAIQNTIAAGTYHVVYDLNCDGVVNDDDLNICRQAMMGVYDLSSFAQWLKDNHNIAADKEVTMKISLANPDRVITFSGTNLWGNPVDKYIGVNHTNIESRRVDSIDEYVVERGEKTTADGVKWYYEKWNSGVAKMYGNINNKSVAVTTDWGSVYRSGQITFTLPFTLTAFLSVVHNCWGNEHAVWGGQALFTSGNTFDCEVFCGMNVTVSTNFYIQVVGRWK